MKSSWIYIFLLILFVGCEEPTDWEIDAKGSDLIVVEGLLTNELKSHSIKLSKPVSELNDTPDPVSGAVVAVQSGSELAVFKEFPEGSGIYYSDTLQAVVNRSYHLYINYQGQEYQASATMVPVTPLKALSYQLVDNENQLYQISFKDSNEPSIKEYWISWGHLPDYEDLPREKTLSETFHYSLSTIDVNQAFSPEQEKLLFPLGSIILRKKYSLSEEHQAFLRTFLSETEWRGSVFDVQKGNVLTNLSVGAIGFFAVSTVISDTTIVLP